MCWELIGRQAHIGTRKENRLCLAEIRNKRLKYLRDKHEKEERGKETKLEERKKKWNNKKCNRKEV